MADRIVVWNTLKDAEDNILQHEASYVVESDTKENRFVVVVKASEMTDPADLTEAKTKANLKAKDIKDAWVAAMAEEILENQASQEGNVTL